MIWDKIEAWARPIRYVFIIIAIGVFIANNLAAFQENQPGLILFLIFGFLWLLSSVFIDLREGIRFSRQSRIQHESIRSYGRYGDNIMIKTLRKHISIIGIFVAFIAAFILYFVPFEAKTWWVVILLFIGPLTILLTRRVELKGRGGENLFRQLSPLLDDVSNVETSIRNFMLEFIQKKENQQILGGASGVQGWIQYFTSVGNQQLETIMVLKRDLVKADPYERSQVVDIMRSFYQILGRILQVESQVSYIVNRDQEKFKDSRGNLDIYKQTHQRIAVQISSMKSILEEFGQEDMFDSYIKQIPNW